MLLARTQYLDAVAELEGVGSDQPPAGWMARRGWAARRPGYGQQPRGEGQGEGKNLASPLRH